MTVTPSATKPPKGFKRLKAACRVPATVANLGPGFDSLGLALNMHNEFAAEIGPSETTVEVIGEGEDTLDRGEDNLVVKSMHYTFDKLGKKTVPAWVRCTNRIPMSRGLGSSSTAIVGGVFLANELCGRPMAQEELFQVAAEIEGHPDNVAPALMGGLTVSTSNAPEGDELPTFQTLAVDVESLAKWKFVVVIPEYEIDTAKARKLLPKKVAFADAVFNIGRASMVVAALLKGPSKSSNAVLRTAMEDRLHQPHRDKLIPHRAEVFDAAYEAGSLGVCVCGAGPAMLSISNKWAAKIGEAMVEEFAKHGTEARAEVLSFEAAGAVSLGVHNF